MPQWNRKIWCAAKKLISGLVRAAQRGHMVNGQTKGETNMTSLMKRTFDIVFVVAAVAGLAWFAVSALSGKDTKLGQNANGSQQYASTMSN